MLTRHDVIKARQSELINEVYGIEQRIQELAAEIDRLTTLKEQRMMEHQLLEEIGDRGIMGDVTKVKKDRMTFEDVMIKLHESAGRPLRIKEIIEGLEKFGYQWSNYYTAYNYITNSHIVQPTGARGYYNVIRGW